jgi:hypothetical protein
VARSLDAMTGVLGAALAQWSARKSGQPATAEQARAATAVIDDVLSALRKVWG